MATLAEKFALLDRPKIEIKIQSQDRKSEITAIYQRPTETTDQILRSALNDEYDRTMDRLKSGGENGEPSAFETFIETYTANGIETCLSTILTDEREQIRLSVMSQLDGHTPPGENATDEARAEWMKVFRPAFEAEWNQRSEAYKEDGLESLAKRAATIRISNMALERASAIYRRQLVASAVFDTDGSPGFADEAEVASMLPTVTILAIAKRVTDELEKARALPLS